jgi:peptide/nickel transport system permease protein
VILLWVFAVHYGWLPASGRVSFFDDPLSSMRHLVLPAFALGSGLAAVLARYTRTTVQEAMSHDFVRTARAKGLAERNVIIHHVLRNSLIPVVTIVALQVGQILAGAVVIERVFTRPGLGRLVVDAIQNRDYLIVQSTLIILVAIFVVVNLAADVAYGLLDPRVRRA